MCKDLKHLIYYRFNTVSSTFPHDTDPMQTEEQGRHFGMSINDLLLPCVCSSRGLWAKVLAVVSGLQAGECGCSS